MIRPYRVAWPLSTWRGRRSKCASARWPPSDGARPDRAAAIAGRRLATGAIRQPV